MIVAKEREGGNELEKAVATIINFYEKHPSPEALLSQLRAYEVLVCVAEIFVRVYTDRFEIKEE